MNKENLLSLQEIKQIILNNNIEDKSKVLSSLEFLKVSEKAEVNYLYGVIDFYGLIGKKCIKNAAKYLEISVSMNHIEANYLLGSIYVTEKSVLDTSRGLELLEFAAEKGHKDAMFNLYSLSKQNVNPNRREAKNWLVKAANSGSENSALIYTQELYFEAKATSSSVKVEQALNMFEDTTFDEFKGEAYFLAAQIYGNSNFPESYNKEKRDYFIQESASIGFPRAIELWKTYEELKNSKH